MICFDQVLLLRNGIGIFNFFIQTCRLQETINFFIMLTQNAIPNVESFCIVDENEELKTMWEELAGFVSRWKAPGLKTIGRILI